MSDASLYVGSVMHRRLSPRSHRFRYGVFWLFFDLDDLDGVCAGLRLLSRNRPNLFALHDDDHGDRKRRPLKAMVEEDLQAAGIDIAGGKIYFLCMPRTAGYSFNPLSAFFCYDRNATLAATVYEVHNTFGERHRYVVASGGRSHGCEKSFYVSPFLWQDMQYRFCLRLDGDRLTIAIKVEQHGRTVLIACMDGQKLALTDANLLRCFARLPFVTMKVILAIHWEALRLWLKRIPLVPRPANRPRSAEAPGGNV